MLVVLGYRYTRFGEMSASKKYCIMNPLRGQNYLYLTDPTASWLAPSIHIPEGPHLFISPIRHVCLTSVIVLLYLERIACRITPLILPDQIETESETQK